MRGERRSLIDLVVNKEIVPSPHGPFPRNIACYPFGRVYSNKELVEVCVRAANNVAWDGFLAPGPPTRTPINAGMYIRRQITMHGRHIPRMEFIKTDT
ncbi:hypothetical protein GWI33_001262 [Rhynchophorus ferrugineus]|uniref:Uncharacterized protein n=1 Tax=Rhynchophorus ferrugineus TaxID=354439 RepID=A0A834HKA5_RHYFE|nr:hypothetical protein GWI33_001262 [Rhynchophorus ferrugineus]